MAIRKFTVTVTTGTATGTGYSPYFSGHLESIQYVKGDYPDGVDFTITADGTGETLWAESNVNASTVRRPRAATHTTAGVANVYASAGEPVLSRIALSRDRVKVAIAEGGNAKSGTFVITVDDGR